jgi:D-3-phosphoglycerate dehydrogenase / 2-oxoglutarate reductase
MKVLASPSSFGQVSDEPEKILTRKGIEVVKNPYGRTLSEDEVITLAAGCSGIIAGTEPLTKRVLDALPSLKAISRVGVGLDNVDMNYAQQKGIDVSSTPDAPTRAVAEFTLAMAFSLMRRIPQANAGVKKHEWHKITGSLLINKTVGIVGLGRIGKMVAELFKALGSNVMAFTPRPDQNWAFENEVQLVELNTLLSNADLVTLHVPGNSDKSPVIGASELNLMKVSAQLINISRGGVVDETALYSALVNGKLAGAAVDVFVQEPYTGPLIELDNVILTPHMGSYAAEAKLQMELDAVNNLVDAL